MPKPHISRCGAGFLYLVIFMDRLSREMPGWRLANSKDAGFGVEALKEALAKYGKPEIINFDNVSQFYQHRFH
nr:DDE-type integrase/transposase/recombinase [Paracoccus sp. JM45]